MTRLADRLLVAGVGLIGGSLAVAAREAGLVREVIGFGRTPANLAVALERGLIDRIATDPATAMDGVDLVLLATPVGSCGAVAATLKPHARPGTILTDAGSVKGSVVAAMEQAWGSAGPVVGAHPIAGSEASGASAARADLFRGRRCILTPHAGTDARALQTVRALWEGVGAVVDDLTAAAHDAILARVSHLPHMVAAALVTAVMNCRVEGQPVDPFVGSGFRDSTRIAASRPELWRDIVRANAAAVGVAIDEFRGALDTLAAAIAQDDAAALDRLLGAAEQRRRALGGLS
jgi:prephenate dehydrogenase